jgi:hypothetical protein
MYLNTKVVACLGVAVAAWSFAMPASADEALALQNVVTLPDGQVLRAFDISWVDPKLHTYALAASALTPALTPPITGPASKPAIVIVDTLFNVVVKELGLGTSSDPSSPNFTPFAGNCPNFTFPSPPRPVQREAASPARTA